MAVSFLEAFVPIKKRDPRDLADPAVVALYVTPIRKVIDLLLCPAPCLQEVAISKVGKTFGLPIVNAKAVGIDIGARIQVAAVPPELSDDPVRTFGSFTADIQAMANWLVSVGIETVAMESTGVYWVPVYEILEEHGLNVLLANARACKAVPGRKITILFYHAMRFGMQYQNPGADQYEQRYRERVVKQLERRAAHFGFSLQAVGEGVS